MVEASAVGKRYPIAELFDSIQGEGLFAGTPMFFVRLAGCSVGKNIHTIRHFQEVPAMPIYAELCRSWDGREFICDTDFRVKQRLTANEILKEIPGGRHVCLTGGEPLIHDLEELVEMLWNEGHEIHLETSGTIDLPEWTYHNDAWIAVSPKFGAKDTVLADSNEIKLLVDKGFSLYYADQVVRWARSKGTDPYIWLQPINAESTLDMENALRCLELLKARPDWRLSIQLHKILGVR